MVDSSVAYRYSHPYPFLFSLGQSTPFLSCIIVKAWGYICSSLPAQHGVLPPPGVIL